MLRPKPISTSAKCTAEQQRDRWRDRLQRRQWNAINRNIRLLGVRINGPVTAPTASAWRIDTTAGGSVRFTHWAAIDSQAGENNDLTLSTGARGMITFNASLGHSQALGQLIVKNTTGPVTFGGADSVIANSDGGPVQFINTTGEIDLGQGTADSNHEIQRRNRLQWRQRNSGDQYNRGRPVRLNGPVAARRFSGMSISTAGGSILFTHWAAIDSQAGENNALTLSAGVGTITFNASLGHTQPLGQLFVKNTTGQVTFGGADGVAVNSDVGPVQFINATGTIDLGQGYGRFRNDISGGIVFNAASMAHWRSIRPDRRYESMAPSRLQ